ncbi:hypothetical protein CLG94_00195 [Candidatus Methylomirabilis limnetica]|uniref:DUF6036 domain-containing protein n=1 Tax=Candidatus Methylomirabilis limnetica TaxID=2033718 RepID=A0A2T4U1J2_9BACT|nr:DUF6036 family nucleotidyltransferase [Candidatus Methylomirabilis limnetica]PTL37233.1 hypothetical protein CLG94_00195 [Candidatus Methylomirabilis limnetica]
MSALTIDQLTALLAAYTHETGVPVDLLLVGGLALQAYGYTDRATQDVDGEVAGDPEHLSAFLRRHHVPADLGENLSSWSVIAMPPGYRDRAVVHHTRPGLRLRLLHPTDFVIAKLRRGTELDLDDAEYVARRFHVTSDTVRQAAEAALAVSPKDTVLFLFRITVQVFCARLSNAGTPPLEKGAGGFLRNT